MATVVLRDILKRQVQLDTVCCAVDRGFRGFQNVLPGCHVVQVFSSDGDPPLQAEIALERPGSVAVLTAGDDRLIVDGSGQENAAMAATGNRLNAPRGRMRCPARQLASGSPFSAFVLPASGLSEDSGDMKRVYQ